MCTKLDILNKIKYLKAKKSLDFLLIRTSNTNGKYDWHIMKKEHAITTILNIIESYNYDEVVPIYIIEKLEKITKVSSNYDITKYKDKEYFLRRGYDLIICEKINDNEYKYLSTIFKKNERLISVKELKAFPRNNLKFIQLEEITDLLKIDIYMYFSKEVKQYCLDMFKRKIEELESDFYKKDPFNDDNEYFLVDLDKVEKFKSYIRNLENAFERLCYFKGNDDEEENY